MTSTQTPGFHRLLGRVALVSSLAAVAALHFAATAASRLAAGDHAATISTAPTAIRVPAAETTPDSIAWTSPIRIHTEATDIWGNKTAAPDTWRLSAQVFSTAASRRFVIALCPSRQAAPVRLPASLCARLLRRRRNEPKAAPGTAVLDTLRMSFLRLHAVAPRSSKPDSLGRRALDATALVDVTTAAQSGPWVAVYDSAGALIHTVRLGDEP